MQLVPLQRGGVEDGGGGGRLAALRLCPSTHDDDGDDDDDGGVNAGTRAAYVNPVTRAATHSWAFGAEMDASYDATDGDLWPREEESSSSGDASNAAIAAAAAGTLEGSGGNALFRSADGDGLSDHLASILLPAGSRYLLGGGAGGGIRNRTTRTTKRHGRVAYSGGGGGGGGWPLSAAGVVAMDCLQLGKNCRVAFTRVVGL
jgi:hypothetical protein